MSDPAPVIPFMPKKGEPPYHLRPAAPAELEHHRRMVEQQEALARVARSITRK